MLLALENMARAYSYAWADVGEQDSYGMELKKWKTSFGTVFVHEHKLLSKLSALRSWGFLVDPDQRQLLDPFRRRLVKHRRPRVVGRLPVPRPQVVHHLGDRPVVSPVPLHGIAL